MTSYGYDLNDEKDREDRRKHLDLVAAIVGRMAGASATAKGWSITVAGTAFGVAVVRNSWYLFVLGIIGLVVFGVIDGLYLHNEKKFRDLYDAIAEDNSVAPFSLKTDNLAPRPKNKSYLSWSVIGFYEPLVLAGTVLLIFSLATPSPAGSPEPHGERHGPAPNHEGASIVTHACPRCHGRSPWRPAPCRNDRPPERTWPGDGHVNEWAS